MFNWSELGESAWLKSWHANHDRMSLLSVFIAETFKSNPDPHFLVLARQVLLRPGFRIGFTAKCEMMLRV